MAKKTQKVVKPKKVAAPKPEPKLFHVELKMNDQMMHADTDDLVEAIAAVAPKAIKTKVIFKITDKDGRVAEKMLFAPRARMLFRVPTFRRIFVQRLIFKTPAPTDGN